MSVALPHSLSTLLRSAIILFLATALVACGDEEEVANETEGAPEDLTPAAADELPEGVEEVSIEIVDGEFSVEEVIGQQGEPTIIHVENQDEQDYRVRIEGLVAAQDIPAVSTTDIEFTTPQADTYTIELLNADDDSVLADIPFEVRAPGGVAD